MTVAKYNNTYVSTGPRRCSFPFRLFPSLCLTVLPHADVIRLSSFLLVSISVFRQLARCSLLVEENRRDRSRFVRYEHRFSILGRSQGVAEPVGRNESSDRAIDHVAMAGVPRRAAPPYFGGRLRRLARLAVP